MPSPRGVGTIRGVGSVFTPELKEAWDDDGWCVLKGAIPRAEIARTEKALTHLFPSAAAFEAGDPSSTPWATWDARWPEFPFKSRSLNALVVHDVLIDLAEQLLGTEDLRIYMALLTAKYHGQSSGFNQLLHVDYPNQMVVVPRRDRGYQQLETFVYLTDVSTSNGATRMVSRRLTADVPVEQHTLNLEDYGHLYVETGDASGSAGSVVAYRPDVYHRSVDETQPGSVRSMLHVAFKPANSDYGGYQAWPIKGYSPEWFDFVRQATPRQLALFSIPRPGDPYWTEETLAGVGARYQGLDMDPWRTATSGD
jgi:Phytanoyl-CoA dioxygenase (PhyH)